MVVTKNTIRAYWDGEVLSEEKGYLIVRGSEWHPHETDGPALAVSWRPDGFYSVLGSPADSNRILVFTLRDSPENGVYTFKPKRDEFDVSVRFEFEESPYPASEMQILQLNSRFSDVTIEDQIIVGLRKDATANPGVKEVSGTVLQVVDSSGAVPDFTRSNVSFREYPIVSILADISESSSTKNRPPASHSLGHKLSAVGDDHGKIDVVGKSTPFEIQWEGSSNTPALPVEYVTVISQKGEEWTVSNESIPELNFKPLEEKSSEKRIEEFRSAFNSASEIGLAEDAFELFSVAVDDEIPNVGITVTYDSPRSDSLQTKSGTLESVQSVYYTEPNRALHQVRFTDSKSYYLLLDPRDGAETPVGIYSKSYSRHWDSELGTVNDIEISVSQ